ncbi:DNA cytosine methyltransferase [Solimonas marina]|uniref:DNA (cytosine-5-)-methyltransferase n=1 Tax=Solimonas marina TaxID=2714601 RepID=A0A970B7S6_9GAMM|nr:DNA cytosine methyltransferase [Solimonas marina]NKF21534.1 DNA cytosine methyltransferase [Solimonas marina]
MADGSGQFAFDLHELIVDSFAGGGGASTGIERALGRYVDVAVNHDGEALAMHAVNHPQTEHIREDVWKVDPRGAIGYRQIGLLWASPDCKHFSKAKGGKPVSKRIRGLAGVVVKWARHCKPRVIMLENVEEFQTWGPLKRIDGQWFPDPARKGVTFDLFVAKLRRLGYKVEWRQLRACDYGAPTIRKRLFLIARRDGLPIIWPKPTHGKGLIPYRTAAECIDWSIPCPSIFERKRPLAEATMKRIARGIMRYVVDAPNPFIVPIANYGSGTRVNSADEPLTTVTANPKGGAHAVVVPTLVGVGSRAGQSRPRSMDEPTATTKTKYDTALVAATLIQAAHGEGKAGGAQRWGSGAHDVETPVGTIHAGGGSFAAVAAHLMHVTHHGDERAHDMGEPVPTVTGAQRGEQALITAHLMTNNTGHAGAAADTPVPTVATGGHHAVVAAFLAQHNTERVGVKAGKDAREPLSTTCASGSHQSVVTSHLLKLRGTCKDGQPIDEPMPTVTGGGTHAAEVRAFLVAYYGNDKDGQGLDEPLRTLPTRDRFGLVTVRGELYQIVDIGMRMLTPRELANAQGFPPDYVIDRGADGKPLTKTAQVRMIGNSVCPPVAEALVRANFAHELAPTQRARKAA